MALRPRFLPMFFLLSFPVFLSAIENEYGYLQHYLREHPVRRYESDRAAREASRPIQVDLSNYYQDFYRDGLIKAFVGTGVEFEVSPDAMNLLMKEAVSASGLSVSGWTFSGQMISFVNKANQIKFEITIGKKRNEFIKSLGESELVAYLGHSRYGRGPAFLEFSNYFRMGYEFSNIEVDTRNPYFLHEPLQDTHSYPPLNVTLDGAQYAYQYRGQKVASSHLLSDSFTKLIPGEAADLNTTPFLSSRQIILISSCISEEHFKRPLRKKFPSTAQKLFFGTTESAGAQPPEFIALVLSIMKEVPTSWRMLEEVRKSAGDFFTTF